MSPEVYFILRDVVVPILGGLSGILVGCYIVHKFDI